MTIETLPRSIPAMLEAQAVLATLAAMCSATCVPLNPGAAGTGQARIGADA